MKRELLIASAMLVLSLAASCGGASAPAPPAPVDTAGPAITVTGVADGETIAGNVQITAAAADPSEVVDFDFEVNGNNVATETDGTMAYMWNTTGNGWDTLKFTATDSFGNSSSVELEVYRHNITIGIWPDFPLLPGDLDFVPIPFPFPDLIPIPDPFPGL
jgi:hypothetical protein